MAPVRPYLTQGLCQLQGSSQHIGTTRVRARRFPPGPGRVFGRGTGQAVDGTTRKLLRRTLRQAKNHVGTHPLLVAGNSPNIRAGQQPGHDCAEPVGSEQATVEDDQVHTPLPEVLGSGKARTRTRCPQSRRRRHCRSAAAHTATSPRPITRSRRGSGGCRRRLARCPARSPVPRRSLVTAPSPCRRAFAFRDRRCCR